MDTKIKDKEILHVHTKKLTHNWNVLLLLIPSIVFAITLAAVFRGLCDSTSLAKENKISLEMKKIKINEIIIPVEIADTVDTRRKGLSDRGALPIDQGMLFIFDQENVSPPFWMKDMKFAIDIIWINDNKIIQIDKNVKPDFDSKLYLPTEPVDNVLEVNAGFSETNNLQVGDFVNLI